MKKRFHEKMSLWIEIIYSYYFLISFLYTLICCSFHTFFRRSLRRSFAFSFLWILRCLIQNYLTQNYFASLKFSSSCNLASQLIIINFIESRLTWIYFLSSSIFFAITWRNNWWHISLHKILIINFRQIFYSQNEIHIFEEHMKLYSDHFDDHFNI